MADGPTVEDHQVREVKPVFLWGYAHQVLLNFDRVLVCCPAKASGETTDMGVYSEACNNTEGVAEHNVGRLSCDTRKCEQVCHGARYFTTILRDDTLAGGPDIPGFVAIEACGFYILF